MPPKLTGVGIDVVELARASRFIRAHKRDLKNFFLPSEYRCFSRSRSKAKAFALLFASKEAVSKALGVSIAHPRQFRDYPITLQNGALNVSLKPKEGTPKQVRRVFLTSFSLKDCLGVMAFAYK